MTPAASRRAARRASWASSPWLSWLLLVLGTFGFAAAWITLGLFNNAQNSWMAVVGALDVAWMLRLGGWPRGRSRVAAALVATLAIVVVAIWGIIATQLGLMLGLTPWESAVRLGFNHAWTLAKLSNGMEDLLWIAAGLVLAGLTSR